MVEGNGITCEKFLFGFVFSIRNRRSPRDLQNIKLDRALCMHVKQDEQTIGSIPEPLDPSRELGA